ncbi:MAG: membrane-bound metal-dependent hydrolase YbcI (DUF457 family) [Phycisphaerales bacterium]|jgi:membrane-bound metal-dependent hydrolase YbcI (DUF457 family)
MPSPIAHTSLLFLALPAAQGAATLTLPRRVALAAMLAVLLVAPDLDFAVSLLNLADAKAAHGTWTHSLIIAIPAGILFAGCARFVFPAGARPGFIRLGLVGAAAYASHVLMDWTNWGFGNARGIQLLWPLSTDRFLSPVHAFVGLRWSEPGAYGSHLLTLSTELLFAALVFMVVRRRRPVAGLVDEIGVGS